MLLFGEIQLYFGMSVLNYNMLRQEIQGEHTGWSETTDEYL